MPKKDNKEPLDDRLFNLFNNESTEKERTYPIKKEWRDMREQSKKDRDRAFKLLDETMKAVGKLEWWRKTIWSKIEESLDEYGPLEWDEERNVIIAKSPSKTFYEPNKDMEPDSRQKGSESDFERLRDILNRHRP